MSYFRFVLLSVLLFVFTACNITDSSVTPSIYLLNHGAWTPELVLNFAREVAPLNERGKPPGHLPQLSPSMEGEWIWQDSSRLVFSPKYKTFQPETWLNISLQGVQLRENYSHKQPELRYKTPALKVVQQDCHWQDILIAPMRRQFEAVVEFNYPVVKPSFTAKIGDIPLPVTNDSHAGSRFSFRSEPLLRPAQNTDLNFKLLSGSISLVNYDQYHGMIAGTPTTLLKGADCQLQALRKDWDKIEVEPPKVPVKPVPLTVNGINNNLGDGTLIVNLTGRYFEQATKKIPVGEEVKTGVSISPAIEGRWTYGKSASSAYLSFTPANPDALKPYSLNPLPPASNFTITVDAAAFPQLEFEKPSYSTHFQTQAMSGVISDVQLSNDPDNPKIKRVTATLDFSYPPKKEQLSANTSVRLRVEPAKSFQDSRVHSIQYELSYDEKNPRRAYLKTVPITVSDAPGEVLISVERLSSTLGGNTASFANTLAIPSALDFLKVTDARTESVIKKDGDIERLLILHLSTSLDKPLDLPKAIEGYVLPDCHEENLERPPLCEKKRIGEWQSPDQVDEDTLKLSTPFPLTWHAPNVDDENSYYLTFQAPEKRQVFFKIKNGIESTDGFKLAKDARFLYSLGENQRELKILHDGALLSLSGSKKLGVAVRGVDKVQVVLQRVLPHNMHHFAQFTRGDFKNPGFKVPIEHFAEKFTYDETLPTGKEMQRHYLAVDFAKFAPKQGNPPRGLFLLSVSEKKDPPKTVATPCPTEATQDGQEATGCEETAAPEYTNPDDIDQSEEDSTRIKDQRLILLTDMGLLVKTATDGHQDVFVMSFRSGLPVIGAQVSLLGMNGNPVFSAQSDAQGRVTFPSTQGFKDEKQPSVYIAEKDGDLSFLPYSRDNRLLDVSRFDIDGLHDTPNSLHAFLFSDRGIYRPGDTAHIGLILKKRNWSALPAGLPLQAIITDPENHEVWRQTVAFGKSGFEEIEWHSPVAGKTGEYRVELLLANKNEKTDKPAESKEPLGYTKLRVEEFQPDRLQVKTEIVGISALGWLNPEKAQAQVMVRNLFGTPAAGNPAKLEMTVRPWSGVVPQFPDYNFRGSLGTNIPDLPEELGEITTDAKGIATFDLPLTAINEPIYEITLAGEGFEKGTGRSVVNVASTLVSKQPFLLGQAADTPLDYIQKDSHRHLRLLALGSDFKPKDNETLSAEIFEQVYVSTLFKREDGLYAYQSIESDESRKTVKITLKGGKANFDLPTQMPGNFYVIFKNTLGEELNRVDYSVAGDGDVSRNIERNAELNLSLNKKEYQSGEEIELQIVAPYQGAGLITIEQNGVLASHWFKAKGTASTHRITIPKGSSGNAYVSVAFVRSLDSREIYMSPLSYAVMPFSISKKAHQNEVTLTVPEKVRSGNNLEVHYSVKETSKIVLYAVDEGILQFAHYRNPAPLDYFFKKRALETKTHQILDLILPDFALVQKLSASGGDEDSETFGKYKNPFARKHKPPLAFWSGILDATAGDHVLSIPVPDYFNGKIRVIAVAVNEGKLAAPVSRSVASNPFVIEPQQPLVVAPDDEFDMGVLVANTTDEKGEKALEVSVNASESLELLTPNPQKINLAQGKDGIVRFKVKAKEKLGNIAVHYKVTGAGQESTYSEEMSIRPAQPLLTTLQNGVLHIVDQQAGKTVKLDQQRTVYDEQRLSMFTVSMTPAAYLRGILEYLKNYPYGCTEQLVSQAFPAVVLGTNAELGLSAEDVDRLFNHTLEILQTRLKHDGSFGFWTVGTETDPFYSMYATHLLLEARERGLKASDAMLDRTLKYADQYSQEKHSNWHEHQAKAYALYLLARNGQNVADRLKAFEANEINQQWDKGGAAANWTRFLLGAAYKLNHLDTDADRFFGEFQRQWKKTGQMPWNLQNDTEVLSLYLYLMNKHFPELMDSKDPQFGRYLLELGQDMAKQRTNSFQGSLTLLGLGTLWERFEHEDGKSFKVLAGKPLIPLLLQGQTVKHALLERSATPVEVSGDGMFNLYYQLTERGYDKAPPTAAINQELIINRWLLNEKGEETQELNLQDKLHIRLVLHQKSGGVLKNIAVVMLIPGGFEIDLSEEGLGSRKSLPVNGKPLWTPDYIDVQEDRVVFFGNLDNSDKYFEFRLKPLNTGTYTVPPVFAEGMYDTDILHRGLAGKIKVVE